MSSNPPVFPTQPALGSPDKSITGASMIAQAIRDLGDLSIFTAEDIGSILYPRTAAEIAAGVTPVQSWYLPGYVERYVANAVPGTTDMTSAFTLALSCNTAVYALYGPYAIQGSITVSGGNVLRGAGGTALTRTGAATTPVLYVIGQYSEAHGFTITTPNASPSGCVVLGNTDAAQNLNAWWWRFTNCDVFGRQNQANDLGVVVISGQVTFPANANYFGTISNVNIQGFDDQLVLDNMANAHNLNNLQFWAGKSSGLKLRGAYGNNVNNLFFHTSAASGYVSIKLANKTAGSTESTTNNILGFTAETGGAADQSLTVDTNCTTNNIVGNSNVAGGWTINNTGNFIALNSAVIASAGMTIGAGALTVSGGLAKFTKGRSEKRTQVTYSASMTIDATTGSFFYFVATNGTAFTINAPTGGTADQVIRVQAVNTSGGALGAATWNAVFKMAAWTSPATGFNRSIEFQFDGSSWYEVSRNTVDIPN